VVLGFPLFSESIVLRHSFFLFATPRCCRHVADFEFPWLLALLVAPALPAKFSSHIPTSRNALKDIRLSVLDYLVLPMKVSGLSPLLTFHALPVRLQGNHTTAFFFPSSLLGGMKRHLAVSLFLRASSRAPVLFYPRCPLVCMLIATSQLSLSFVIGFDPISSMAFLQLSAKPFSFTFLSLKNSLSPNFFGDFLPPECCR